MVNHDAPIPLYIQIKEYIQRNIENGQYRLNEKIPSERQLAEQFNVNRLTVSKAIKELTREGLLYSRLSKGTYVAPPRFDQALQSLTSFTEDMTGRGKKPASRVIYAAVEPADDEIARLLGIPTGAEVVALHRIRMADHQVIALEKSYINHALCPRILEKHDFSRESLYRTLREEYRLQLEYAHQTMQAQLIDDEEAALMGAKPLTPILYITRVTFDRNDQPVEFVCSSYRGDCYTFNALLRRLD